MTDTATRRALLAGLAAAPVAAIPASAEWKESQNATYNDPAARARHVVRLADAAIDELFDRYGAAAWDTPELVNAQAGREEALGMLARTRAHTMEGLAAKSEALLALPYADSEHRDALGVSLARDVQRMRIELAA